MLTSAAGALLAYYGQRNDEAEEDLSELIHTYSTLIQGEGGMTYRVSAHGTRRDDGMWIGWLEFKPTKVDAPTFRTEWETVQPNRDALVYWAGGLEPVYLEGALERIKSVAEE